MEQRQIVGRINPQRGHSLFEFNTETLHLRKVDDENFDKELITSGRTFRVVKNYTAEKGCVYVSALNYKNAVKKVAKYYGVKL